jgi:hypothetical protein
VGSACWTWSSAESPAPLLQVRASSCAARGWRLSAPLPPESRTAVPRNRFAPGSRSAA